MTHLISSSSLQPVLEAQKNNSGADFTIKSLKTGNDYTYRIARSEFKGSWYTHVLVETQYQNFVRIGTYRDGLIRNKNLPITTPSAVAIAWVLKNVEAKNFAALDKSIEVMHTGHCLRCGKVLTDASSIQSGLGPVCRG